MSSAVRPIFEPVAVRDARPASRTRRAHSIARSLASHGLVVVQCMALVLALISALECHSVVTHTAPGAPFLPSLLYGLLFWYWWGLAATVIWKLAERNTQDFFSLPSAVRHAIFAALLAGVHVWLLQKLVTWLVEQWPVLGLAGYASLNFLDVNRYFTEILLYGFVFGLTGVIHLQMASQREAMRALALEKQLSAAHLQALQMQMEPHFLFNTLNAIASLVESGRTETAMQMLGHLNAILKRTLAQGPPQKAPLSEELKLVDDYLSIEETRFADRLKVDMTIEPGALQGLAPSFLLQPLIENAIRHGISRCEENGSIEIKAERRGSRLHLAVRDTGPGMDGNGRPGHGIGLKNTRERLAHFYGEKFDFRTRTPEEGGFEVVIDIPFERAE